MLTKKERAELEDSHGRSCSSCLYCEEHLDGEHCGKCQQMSHWNTCKEKETADGN